MNVRNFLKPADYVVPIPLGLPLELAFNEKGNLSSIYNSMSYSEDVDRSYREELEPEFKKKWFDDAVSPLSISLSGGTTYVFGVLVGPNFTGCEGKLPECMMHRIAEGFLSSSPNTYKFYAYRVVSYATNFSRSYTALRWLQMSGFSVLDGQLMPTTVRENDAYFSRILCKVGHPTIPVAYAAYRMSECFIYSSNIKEIVVTDVLTSQDLYGEVWVNVSSLDSKYVLDYDNAARLGVSPGDVLWMGSDGKVVYSYSSGDARSKYTYTCPRCGGPLTPTIRGGSMCADEDCPSRLYPRMVRMLEALHMPPLDKDVYEREFGREDFASLIDVFCIPEYSSISADVTLVDVLNSLLMPQFDSCKESIQYFVNRCNNNVKTVKHYIYNYEKLKGSDVYGNDVIFWDYIEWLNIPSNWILFESLLELNCIHIDSTIRKFEGAPIFRNRSFLLTGTFRHGTVDDAKAILRSYGASILDTYSPNMSALIVGDILEDVNGEWLRRVRESGIPEIYESTLFSEHGIDEDLQKMNLL